MEQNIICPICHGDNSIEAKSCTHCSQRLKAYNLDDSQDTDDANGADQKKLCPESRVKKVLTTILSVLLIISVLIVMGGQQVLSGIYELMPRKISNINDLENTVNQYERFDLPEKIGAKMEYGENKAVPVNWETNMVDTSAAGVKTVKGKIDGYERTILFTVKVLPNQIRSSINNCTVENSLLQLNTNVSNNIKWIWFKLQKDGQVKDEVISVDNGLLNARIYLPYGAGNYQILVRTCTLDSEPRTFYRWKEIMVRNNDTRDMGFLMPDANVQSDSEKIRNLAYKITEKSITDREKTLAIHDWVCTNIAYDVDALANNTVHTYNAIETMEGKKAVCNGYANLTAALNRSIGIRTKIISGTANNNYFDKNSKDNGHAWNETYVDGKWIIQDTTWDAGGVNEATKKFGFNLSHKYFDPSPSVFSLDHALRT